LRKAEGDIVHNPEAPHRDALPTASGAITRLAYAHAKQSGVELEPILKKAHLTLHDIENFDARLRVRDQIRFLDLVAVALQDDFLGFRLAQPADLREMGWLYYVAASSDIMGDALKRGARYSSIVNEGISLKYIENGDVAVTIDYVGVSRHLDRHQMEFLMTTLVRLCRQLTGLRLVPSRVRFTHHRKSTSPEFAEFFGNDVIFGAATDEVVFATAIRTMPVVSADPYQQAADFIF
jgi:Arabinose-binding domain of AraC transcription regulator, N-term